MAELIHAVEVPVDKRQNGDRSHLYLSVRKQADGLSCCDGPEGGGMTASNGG